MGPGREDVMGGALFTPLHLIDHWFCAKYRIDVLRSADCSYLTSICGEFLGLS
jgi:hypothetical protein